jgi:hypothetical protein
MKIIKQPDAQWSYTFMCGECDSELQADAGDLVHHHYDGDQREPGYDTWCVNCPVCSHATQIKEDKIPKIVKINHAKKQSYGGPFDR